MLAEQFAGGKSGLSSHTMFTMLSLRKTRQMMAGK